MLQILADGLVIGSVIALGAIGLSMTLSIVRFSNFSHGELLGWGAYIALMASTALGAASANWSAPLAPFSFGWGLLLSLLVACVLTALLGAVAGDEREVEARAHEARPAARSHGGPLLVADAAGAGEQGRDEHADEDE